MLGLIDPEKGTLRLFRLVALDIAVVLVLLMLVAGGLLPLVSTVVVGYVALFVANVLIAQRAARRGVGQLEKVAQAPKVLWFAALVFSPAAAAAVLAWMRKPDLPLTVEAASAVLLVGYIWFLLYRLRRTGTRGRSGSSSS